MNSSSSLRIRRARRSVACIGGLALLVGLVGAGCSRDDVEAVREAEPSTRPTHVIVILSDDQGWGDYGFMGHPRVQTPNIDRLASESLVYTRGYVPTSTCRPSLASIITGLHPHEHGITGNAPAGEENSSANQQVWVDAFRSKARLPALLADAGWASMQTGKWWEGGYESGGFTLGLTRGNVDAGERFGDAGLEIGRDPRGLGPFLQQLDGWKEKPYFLWYAPMLPHKPHDAPERLVEKNRRPGLPEAVVRYEATVEWFDEGVGELLDYLEESGLAENTLVIYLADNGWIQRPDPKGWGDWGPAKLSPYDAGVRTPIMFRWPGEIAPRRDDTHLASSIDLMPTVLRALELAVPEELPGIDLLDPEAVAGRDAIFGSIHARQAVDAKRPVTSLKWRWVVAGRYKLIDPYLPNADVPLKSYLLGGNRGGVADRDIPWFSDEVQLFDLIDDPGETTNLAAQDPERVEALERRLDGWWPVASEERATP